MTDPTVASFLRRDMLLKREQLHLELAVHESTKAELIALLASMPEMKAEAELRPETRALINDVRTALATKKKAKKKRNRG
jgi:hypothetical protein